MTINRICIIGPGAIGGMMAVKLANAGFEVSALVRPHRVDGMNKNGLTLLDEGQTFHAVPNASAQSETLGPQDLVVITVKENNLKDVAPNIGLLVGNGTQVVQVTNGIPWWFFLNFGDSLEGTRLSSVDKDNCVSDYFLLSRHIGGVINCGVSVRDDGVLVHDHSNQLYLGRPSNDSAGVEEVAAVFQAAGYKTSVAASIHQQVMTKLLANISYNPLSALTMGTLDLMLNDELVAEALIGLMNEGRSVTKALGLDPGPDPAERVSGGSRISSSKTSMLQDMEHGKPLELDGILASTIEVAGLLDVPVPMTKTVYGLLRVREQVALGQGAQ
jgi:2-dehydropantoate 2-reductase